MRLLKKKLMQSYRFPSDLSAKVSNFSKTVRTISLKFCGHSSPKGAPACAMTSKSFDWDLRIIAKKNYQKTVFGLFSIFSEVVDSNEIFYSHATPY